MAKYVGEGREAVYNLDTYIGRRIVGNSHRSLTCVGGPEESSYHNYSKVVNPRKSPKVELETMVATRYIPCTFPTASNALTMTAILRWLAVQMFAAAPLLLSVRKFDSLHVDHEILRYDTYEWNKEWRREMDPDNTIVPVGMENLEDVRDWTHTNEEYGT